MQSIQIKYLPATNTKGARLKATCESQASAKKFNLATAETLLKRFASSKPEIIEIQDL